jgi:long-chain fatty acid transport protein
MKIVSSRIALVAAMLSAAAPAAATNGMRMIGFGPVQDSMGGASVGAPLDAATVVTNPAGMSSLGARVDLSGTWFDPTVKYTVDPSFGTASGKEQKSTRSASLIPMLGVILPVGDKLAFGLGVVGVSGMGVDYPADLYGSKTMTSYMNLRVAPAVSYKLSDQLALGVAANLMYATMEWDVAGAMGAPARKDGSSFGYGATVGLTFKPMKELTVGLAYETKSFFQDFSFDLPAPLGTEKLAFNQPQVVTLGASFQATDALLVAADVEWIGWSSIAGKDQPRFTQTTLATQPWNMNWSDQVVVKVGAQFAATKELKVRAGYNYGKMPLDKNRALENIAFPAIAEHHITLGAGYDIGALTVNVAAVYAPEAKITGANAIDQGIPGYDTKMSQIALDLGVAYKF